jgi:hypothetical protein
MAENGEARVEAGPPGWYWIASIAALLFELLGCFFFYLEYRMSSVDLAGLPLDQRAMLEARPDWYYAAFGLAVGAGLVGALGLLLRKGWAGPLLLASLVFAVLQFSSILIVPAMRESTPSDALAVPIVVIVCCYGIWQLARLAKRRGWLH